MEVNPKRRGDPRGLSFFSMERDKREWIGLFYDFKAKSQEKQKTKSQIYIIHWIKVEERGLESLFLAPRPPLRPLPWKKVILSNEQILPWGDNWAIEPSGKDGPPVQIQPQGSVWETQCMRSTLKLRSGSVQFRDGSSYLATHLNTKIMWYGLGRGG